MPVPQRKRTHGMPTKSETTVIVHGIGNAFWHRLLVMLYITLRKYHEKKRRPWGAEACESRGSAGAREPDGRRGRAVTSRCGPRCSEWVGLRCRVPGRGGARAGGRTKLGLVDEVLRGADLASLPRQERALLDLLARLDAQLLRGRGSGGLRLLHQRERRTAQYGRRRDRAKRRIGAAEGSVHRREGRAGVKEGEHHVAEEEDLRRVA